LALSFFFGDEFGSLASFLVDAVAAVLFASLLAPRHHHIAIGGGFLEGGLRQLAGGLGQRRKHARAMGFGGVGVPGRGGEKHCAIRHLLVCPAAEPGVERLDQMMAATARRTLHPRGADRSY